MREYGAGMLAHVLGTRPERLEPAFAGVARRYVDDTDRIHDLWEAGPSVVVHGDGHLTNLFVDAGRLGFFDWGCFAAGPGMRDVSYFLCMALSIEVRREHERSLIERYLSQLGENGGNPPAFDEAWELHRLHAAYTVPAAAPAVLGGASVADQAEYAAAFVRRASAAVEDLDTLDVLRRLL